MHSPVLFLVFNRPATTRRVMESIRAAQPRRLYLASDGPRPGRSEEAGKVEAVREVVLDGIDWPCEVKTLFREENLGLSRAVSEAITWFFAAEEEGIILEDDCLPDPYFFEYCEELLDRYRDDPTIMHISGGCHLEDPELAGSYYMSKYPHIWGWATWRSAWDSYSTDLAELEPEVDRLVGSLGTSAERRHWTWIFRQTFAGKIESWSYYWMLSVWRHGGWSIYPAKNMVQNIGFGPDAVHTKAWKDYRGLRKLPLESFPGLIHPEPPGVRPDLDLEVFRRRFERQSLPVRAMKVLRRSAGHALDLVRCRLRQYAG